MPTEKPAPLYEENDKKGLDTTLARELAPFEHTSPGSHCVLITMDRYAPHTGNTEWIDALDFLNGTSLSRT